MTSPGRSCSSDADDLLAPVGAPGPGGALLDVVDLRWRSRAYSMKSPRSQVAASAYPSSASSALRSCRASPTTALSAWNWANDDSSSSRAALAAELVHQVDRHVVRRPEASTGAGRCGWTPGRRPPRGFMPGCQSTTPWPSTSRPRRPARPVSWVYSPGVMSACVSPFHLTSFSMTTVRAGMLMPSASVSVAKTTLHRPRGEQLLHALLERRQHARRGARRCRGSGRRGSRGSPGRAGRRRGGAAQRSSTNAWISSRSSGVVSRRFGAAGTAAPPRRSPTRLKMKTIAGSRPSRSSRSTTSKRLGIQTRRPLPTWRRRWSAAPPALALGVRRSRIRLLAQSSRATRTSSALTGAPSFTDPAAASMSEVGEQVEQPLADHDVLVERDRPPLLDDRGRSSPRTVCQPLAELLGVGHRRRQRDHGHRLGQVDDHLLPDRAARSGRRGSAPRPSPRTRGPSSVREPA